MGSVRSWQLISGSDRALGPPRHPGRHFRAVSYRHEPDPKSPNELDGLVLIEELGERRMSNT